MALSKIVSITIVVMTVVPALAQRPKILALHGGGGSPTGMYFRGIHHILLHNASLMNDRIPNHLISPYLIMPFFLYIQGFQISEGMVDLESALPEFDFVYAQGGFPVSQYSYLWIPVSGHVPAKRNSLCIPMPLDVKITFPTRNRFSFASYHFLGSS